MTELDHTHDPDARSWVPGADTHPDFPVQNLPFGRFVRPGVDEPRVGVAIGNQVLDLNGLAATEGLRKFADLRDATMNDVMGLDPVRRGALRHHLFDLLSASTEADRTRVEPHLTDASDVVMLVPAEVGDFTDFYASIHHATRVGQLFRPDNPLLPNYRWIPIGYHGRASSVVVSGTPIRRPNGQLRPSEEGTPPRFGPSERLDYELEVGAFVAGKNALGDPIRIGAAEERLFGLCLVNDWSARDIQGWEYQPLGPFLGKSFATSVTPWVVTREALAPFRSPAARRADGDPDPLPYLVHDRDRTGGGVDLQLEVTLRTSAMIERGDEPVRLTEGNARDLYWTFGQMLTHHASNGCNLRAGDLIASGTVSGPERSASGCLLELTTGGREPLQLPDGEQRTFLQDGDEVTLQGRCSRAAFRTIGFGTCVGRIATARGT